MKLRTLTGKLVLEGAFLALAAFPAQAQVARVVTACGSLAPFGPETAGGTAYPTMDINGRLCLSGGGAAAGAITPDGTGLVVQRNATQAQAFRVYNIFTDASNGEWGVLDWQTTPNVLTIGTQANGTGATRNITIAPSGGTINLTATNINIPSSSSINAGTGSWIQIPTFISYGPSPTIAASGGTCAVGTKVGGPTAGTVVLTGVCATGNTITISAMLNSYNGYSCDAEDRTTRTALFVQSASTVNSVTFTTGATSSVAADVLQWKCMGY